MYFLSYTNLKRITRFIYGVINLTNSQKCAKRWEFLWYGGLLYNLYVFNTWQDWVPLQAVQSDVQCRMNAKLEVWKLMDNYFCNIFFRSAPSSPDISPQSSPRPHRPSSDRLSILTKLVKKGEKKGLFVEKMPVRIYQVSHNYSSWIRC